MFTNFRLRNLRLQSVESHIQAASKSELLGFWTLFTVRSKYIVFLSAYVPY
jgi:hypothetical protein